MSKVIRIGAATAFFNDSRMGIAQLLEKGEHLDYVIFDFLAESVMGGLGRAMAAGTGPGFATDFIDGYIMPHLPTLLDRGTRIIANAGGLNPAACAEALRTVAARAGLSVRVGVVEGDNLIQRVNAIVETATVDMFDGSSVLDKIAGADRVNSLVAYTGAFPIAAALEAGADIVVTGRAVDSALALGALIHEFGWSPDDFDLLAAGTLAGHLLECSAQVTGGTFTDWQDVPDWAGIGMPIGECTADGALVVTKPDGTGGIVSIGTVSEQLLYEVSDPQRYFVADVICDFTQVRLEQVGPDRVKVSGARGLGRTSTYKASLTYDAGWRASATLPIIGLDAAAKARRTGEELFKRAGAMLRDSQLPPFERTRCDVFGGEVSGHYFFGEIGRDDGLYATLFMLEILRAAGRDLAALSDSVPRHVITPDLRLPAPPETARAILAAMKTAFDSDTGCEVSTLDGVRVAWPDGWALARSSVTEPLLTLRFEARTQARLDEIKRTVTERVPTLKEIMR